MPGDRPPGSPGGSAGNGGGPPSGVTGPPLASKGKTDRPPAGSTGRTPGRPSKNAKRAEHVEKLTSRLARGAVLVMLVDSTTSDAIMRHTPAIAEAAADVAEQYPWAAKFLDKTVAGGSLLGLGSAVGLLGLEIAANKGLLPDALNDMFATPGHDRAEATPEKTQERPHDAPTMSTAAQQARDRLAAFAPPAGAR